MKSLTSIVINCYSIRSAVASAAGFIVAGVLFHNAYYAVAGVIANAVAGGIIYFRKK
ncbi:MAG TPA: hypothetical protein VEV15_13570 [Flavisolibacter sp.]|nr:hypothetical protein [Flavisolibacter sp.]